ncbi:MAG: hypothetical protein ACRENE_11525 [Polyangiaceae bacterium]
MLVAEWIGIGTLFVTRDGTRHDFQSHPAASEREVQRIGGAVVRSLVGHLQGRPALHASAVTIHGHALVFLGKSGAGKSTMASELCSQHGAALAADDVTFVDASGQVPLVRPLETSHRLLKDEASSIKEVVPAQRVAQGPAAIAALILLESTVGDPALAPLEGSSAFAAVNDGLVRFITDDDACNARDFQSVGRIARCAPVWTLRRGASPARAADLVVRGLAEVVA